MTTTLPSAPSTRTTTTDAKAYPTTTKHTRERTSVLPTVSTRGKWPLASELRWTRAAAGATRDKCSKWSAWAPATRAAATTGVATPVGRVRAKAPARGPRRDRARAASRAGAPLYSTYSIVLYFSCFVRFRTLLLMCLSVCLSVIFA